MVAMGNFFSKSDFIRVEDPDRPTFPGNLQNARDESIEESEKSEAHIDKDTKSQDSNGLILSNGLYYRYKVPDTVLKIEGIGKRTKTLFSNLNRIANSLKTNPECMNVLKN